MEGARGALDPPTRSATTLLRGERQKQKQKKKKKKKKGKEERCATFSTPAPPPPPLSGARSQRIGIPARGSCAGLGLTIGLGFHGFPCQEREGKDRQTGRQRDRDGQADIEIDRQTER